MNLSYILSWKYYEDLLHGHRRFPIIRTFVIISGIIALIFSIQASYFLRPILSDMSKKMMSIVDEIYPKELEVTITDGIASTNVPEPYVITVSSDIWNRLLFDDVSPVAPRRIRLLVIDTNGSVDDFESYNAFALLTKKHLIIKSENKTQLYPLSDVGNITISKPMVKGSIQNILDHIPIKSLSLLLFVGFLLVTWVIGFSYLCIMTLIWSLISFIIKSVYRISTGFRHMWEYTTVLSLPWVLFAWILSYFLQGASGFLGFLFIPIIVIGLSYEGIRRCGNAPHEAKDKGNTYMNAITSIFAAPFFLLRDVLYSDKTIGKKILLVLFSLYLLFHYWWIGYREIISILFFGQL